MHDHDGKKTAQLFALVLVLFLALDVAGCSFIRDIRDQDRWEKREIVFASMEYVEPEADADEMPLAFLSWEDEEDGHYRMTDADGLVWVLNPGQVMLEEFRSAVQTGDRVTIWWETEDGESAVRAIEGYYDLETSIADGEAAARRLAGVLVFTSVATVLAGYCLVRLMREGESFRRKLPKWIREGD